MDGVEEEVAQWRLPPEHDQRASNLMTRRILSSEEGDLQRQR